jgi:hypothetical protein
VDAVLGLVEDDRVGAVDDVFGHLLATVGGKAVHEDGVRPRMAYQRRVDLERLQRGAARERGRRGMPRWAVETA